MPAPGRNRNSTSDGPACVHDSRGKGRTSHNSSAPPISRRLIWAVTCSANCGAAVRRAWSSAWAAEASFCSAASTFFRAARTPGVPKDGTIVGAPDAKVRPFPPIAHESTTGTGLKHLNGTISLGRFAPGTATSNFFICVGDQPYLDANPKAAGDNLGYAAFGQVVQGMPIVEKILSLPTNGETKFKDQRGQWLKPPVPILTMRRA